MPDKFNTKTHFRIGGKMSEKGADKAGVIIALAIMVISVGAAVSAILWAAHYYY